MGEQLLTQKDLAERWQLSVQAIENYRKEGTITPVKGIPAIRFTLQHIQELEGINVERFSPLEKKRLESEFEKINKQNAELKSILGRVLAESSKIVGF
ncbi:histidine kinase [Clostridium gasigenes]|uniref:histidine kinase n=1 Tax=Clostridium gasigenes TaxID=94869 RepID=UPI0016250144|nr:histidine kinase [Clostridium gasigenes]MBB6622066.1 histidine kinase [Clostridium gasigenes]